MAQLELQKLKQFVEQAADLTSDARVAAERDRDYYDEHQWTAEEIAVLQSRQQPVIVDNRIKRKVDAMVGIEQQSRMDPRAYPRNPQDEGAADAATKALTFVDDNTRFDAKRSMAFENLLVEGVGGVEVVVEEKRGRFEIAINRIRWEEIFYDPHSREKDFSDASYLGCMKWMTKDAALSMYADAYMDGAETEEEAEKRLGELSDLLDQSMKATESGETYDDRPEASTSFYWGDGRQKRVRIAQMYYQNGGKWYLAIFCGSGEILNDVSPYLDEDGEPTCPIILMTAYIDRENRRYGVVRSMISAQDEINKRRSKLLHQLNSRQTMGVKGTVASVAAMKRELAKPDGHVELNLEQFEDAVSRGIRPFEILQNTDQIAGQYNLLTEAKAAIDMIGPNASLLGQLQGDQSGRAIMAQQQAGFAELAPIYDSLRDWTIRVYRAIWERIKQYWTEERWIRVTDSTGRPEYVALNQQVGMQPVIGPEGVIMQPVLQNAVGEMDMDIIIDDIPDRVTLRQEQFEQLTQLAQMGIEVPPELLIEASSIRDKAAIIEKMEERRLQAMQAQMQQMEREARLEEAKAAAEIQHKVSQAKENDADATKTLIEAQRAAMGY